MTSGEPPPNRRTAPPGGSDLLAVAVVALTATAAVAFGVLLLTIPAGFEAAWGLAPDGAQVVRTALGLTGPPSSASPQLFAALVRASMLLMWAGWVLVAVFGVNGRVPGPWLATTLVAFLLVALAVVAPPVLSRDVFGYVAYGRLPGLYGMNPYEHGRSALVAVGDPSGAFLGWSTPLPYGPVWTMMASAIATVGRGDFYFEVVAHKLLAAAGLAAAAIAGARLAALREPGAGTLTWLAIGLNPLLLVEGPMTGHNDVAMMGLLTVAAALSAAGRWWIGTLVLGLAIAVKPVAAAAAPLLIYEYWLRASDRRAAGLAVAAALASAPTLMLSFLYGGPVGLIDAVFARVGSSRTGTAGLLGLACVGLSLLWAGRVVRQRLSRDPAAWFTAWMPVALAAMLFGSRLWFPWYLSWAMVPALTGWDPSHRTWIVALSTIWIVLAWFYTVTP
jgi:hypothetical protein